MRGLRLGVGAGTGAGVGSTLHSFRPPEPPGLRFAQFCACICIRSTISLVSAHCGIAQVVSRQWKAWMRIRAGSVDRLGRGALHIGHRSWPALVRLRSHSAQTACLHTSQSTTIPAPCGT